MSSHLAEEWVMLTARMPREPSTPRSTVWRKLCRLGVAQLADGLVALPADARSELRRIRRALITGREPA